MADCITYLKDKQYYSDLYDRCTVDDCRRTEELMMQPLNVKIKGAPKKELIRAEGMVKALSFYFLKGSRYENKEKTIREWMDRDGALDDKLEKSIPLKGVSCLRCSGIMECIIKDLVHAEITDHVLFMYECKDCNKRRAFYDNGSLYHPQLTQEERDTVDLDFKIENKVDENFEADRLKYCFSDKEGMDYISQKEAMKHFANMTEEKEKQIKAEEKEKLKKVLSFPEVRKLITELLEKQGLSEINFSQPEVNKSVSVTFTAIADNDFNDKSLQIDINRLLDNTNWVLRNNVVGYQLGVVSGELKSTII